MKRFIETVKKFTFYYIYIKTKLQKLQDKDLEYLHSTIFILKHS